MQREFVLRAPAAADTPVVISLEHAVAHGTADAYPLLWCSRACRAAEAGTEPDEGFLRAGPPEAGWFIRASFSDRLEKLDIVFRSNVAKCFDGCFPQVLVVELRPEDLED